jgi:acetyltransferase-like isoleucine patch superfamily enzyme
MLKNSFLSEAELKDLGLKSYGTNVLISRFARVYSPEKMAIGNHVRIDDFCLLSGEISLGSYIHISAYAALYAACGIEMQDYSGLSPRVTIFSATDDFSGNFLINPMVMEEYTHVTGGKIVLRKYVQIGANSIIMPGIEIGEGAVTGAFTLINEDLEEWKIYCGIPARILRDRKKDLLGLLKKGSV